VLRDLDPRVTALARPRSNCMSKLQTHLLVREDALHHETRKYHTENKNLVMCSRFESDRGTGRLTVDCKLTSITRVVIIVVERWLVGQLFESAQNLEDNIIIEWSVLRMMLSKRKYG
jgi:hypothetical protein